MSARVGDAREVPSGRHAGHRVEVTEARRLGPSLTDDPTDVRVRCACGEEWSFWNYEDDPPWAEEAPCAGRTTMRLLLEARGFSGIHSPGGPLRFSLDSGLVSTTVERGLLAEVERAYRESTEGEAGYALVVELRPRDGWLEVRLVPWWAAGELK